MDQFDIPYAANPEKIFLQLSTLPDCVWLDSGKPDSHAGRYDILSAMPAEIIQGDLQTVQQQLEKRLASCNVKSSLPFCGGWIGYFGYTCRHAFFKISIGKPDFMVPVRFGWYDWAVVIDHLTKSSRLLFLPTCSAHTRQVVTTALASENNCDVRYTCEKFATDESRESYLNSLNKVRHYLLAGDCYQVNYTQRFSAQFSGSAIGAYLNLRHAVPSPFSAFLTLAEGAILSISPERFIQLNDRQALTQPIKGTAPRGRTPAEDELRKKTLLESKKNRAENVMIVDLLRNDFSQFCLPHSVKVPELFSLQTFANVHHLVSGITGTMRDDVSHPEFILSCFPGGSITGAPKKRAMEIIEELESHSRTVYCGSIGYFSTNRNSDFNIAIRTLLLHQSHLYAWAGGGIVADSDPMQEYQESLYKIGSLLEAVTKSPTDEKSL